MSRFAKLKHYNLNANSKSVLNINSFGGVDFTNQRFNVSTGRAIDALNFIYKDGVIQKREGFSQIGLVPTINYYREPYNTETNEYGELVSNEKSKQFNGIWNFKGKDGAQHVITHIGKVLFEIKNIGKNLIKFELLRINASGIYPTTYEHLNQKSMAFVGNDALWFLGGVKYMYITFNENGLVYKEVENDADTFIPTTTMSITYANAIVKERSSLDYANILTIWRRNLCLSGVGKEATDERMTEYYEYTLDAPIVLKDSEKDVERLKTEKVVESISHSTLKELSKIHIILKELETKDIGESGE